MGLNRLAEIVAERLSGGFAEIEIEASVGNGRLLAWLTQHAEELSRTYTDETYTRVRIVCRIPRQAIGQIPGEDVTFIEHAAAT